MELSQFRALKDSHNKGNDKSRKGSIDAEIQDIVSLLNSQSDFITTSSCSGRVILFSPKLKEASNCKEGCRWLLVSHQPVSMEQVTDVLKNSDTNAVVLKFEPFILHVLCRRLEDAQLLHSAVLEAGFKNSGLTVSKKGRITLAVRSTLCMEVPFCSDGCISLQQSQHLLSYFIEIANQKMEENIRRIDKLRKKLFALFISTEAILLEPSVVNCSDTVEEEIIECHSCEESGKSD